MLYDKKGLYEALEKDLSIADNAIKVKAKKLAQGRELIGLVVSVWFDHIANIIYMNSKKGYISREDAINLLRFIEADCRRAVKKDKDKLVYGAVISGIVMNSDENELVEHYAERLGINITGAKKALEKLTGEFRYYYALKLVVSHMPDCPEKQMFYRLKFVTKPVDLFERIRGRRYGKIVPVIDIWIRRFKDHIEPFIQENSEERSVVSNA